MKGDPCKVKMPILFNPVQFSLIQLKYSICLKSNFSKSMEHFSLNCKIYCCYFFQGRVETGTWNNNDYWLYVSLEEKLHCVQVFIEKS